MAPSLTILSLIVIGGGILLFLALKTVVGMYQFGRGGQVQSQKNRFRVEKSRRFTLWLVGLGLAGFVTDLVIRSLTSMKTGDGQLYNGSNNNETSVLAGLFGGGDSDPYTQTFSGDFVKEVRFDKGGKITVDLAAGHGSEALVVYHAADNPRNVEPVGSYGGGLANDQDMPRYAGTVSWDIASQLKDDGPFPSNRFKLIGFDQTISLGAETTGRVRFSVPQELMPGD